MTTLTTDNIESLRGFLIAARPLAENDINRLCNAALKGLEASEQWQPIETAPKDKPVWAYSAEFKGFGIAIWSSMSGRWKWQWPAALARLDGELPAWWMLLPTTPSIRALTPDTDPEPDRGHASDCAVYNGPALPVGPCDCGVSPEMQKAIDDTKADTKAAFDATAPAKGEDEIDAFIFELQDAYKELSVPVFGTNIYPLIDARVRALPVIKRGITLIKSLKKERDEAGNEAREYSNNARTEIYQLKAVIPLIERALLKEMRKPSLAMLAAGGDAWRADRTRRTTTLWKAMLDAFAKEKRGIDLSGDTTK